MAEHPNRRSYKIDQASLLTAVSILKEDMITLDEIVYGERNRTDENAPQNDRLLTRKVFEILIDPTLDDYECLDQIIEQYRLYGWSVDSYQS